ncbi:carbohydrate ABC transporter permease [Anaerosporobacter faecicola]|uniref:carbohydrate ABC transporter permease n=1 Tax=Anaerosporobacter faecicola TaxID=2718714 RepID=UPI00143985BE|nr:sugar ABC transporter permease [Anaerosporobacter faecicola]
MKIPIEKYIRTKRARKETLLGIGFLLPSLIGVSIFVLIPFMDAIRRSFSETMTRKFVGFENYRVVFANEAFQLAAKNTGKFLLVCIPLLLVLSLTFSVLLYSVKRLQNVIKTTFLIPMVIPAASIVLLWKVFFDEYGLLNKIMIACGGTGTDWMNSNKAFLVLVFTYIWKNIGYDIILWLAGLNGISESIYEAASVDGAGSLQKFIYITIPNLMSTLFIVTVLSLINSFKVFREAYLIAGDYPHESIYMLQHVFNNWFTNLDIQKMCAGAVLVAIVLLGVIVLIQKLTRSDKEEIV